MKEKMKVEIDKVQDATQKAFLEKILDYETTNNIDIEKSPILEGMLPIMLGRQMAEETGKEIDAEVWYQQYRTMKALLRKQTDVAAKNRQTIEEGVQLIAQTYAARHPEASADKLVDELRESMSELETAANNIGYDLAKSTEEDSDEEGPNLIDLFDELNKSIK